MIRSLNSTVSSSAEAARLVFVAALALAGAMPASAGARPQERLLLAHPYPIEAVASFPGGLFHWIDSLAGTSNGKTIPAHRLEYIRLFGKMTDEDRESLRGFVESRAEHLRREEERAALDGDAPRASAMLGIFCGSATVEDALATLKPELSPEAWTGLSSALARFRPRYERVWRDGAIPKRFLEDARRDPARAPLGDLLAKLVRFYGVDPLKAPPPRVALVPVPEGWGTHAEAIGGILLLEIREHDELPDEASVLVHESSHFLWGLVPGDRKRRLTLLAQGLGDAEAADFRRFGEAIPTALGQGVADRMFRPESWSIDGPWYHIPDIDLCAKRIYPTISSALDTGLVLDEELVRRALEAARSAR